MSSQPPLRRAFRHRRLATVVATAVSAVAAVLAAPGPWPAAADPDQSFVSYSRAFGDAVPATSTSTPSSGVGAAPSLTSLSYHGGSIQRTPKVYLVYWGWPATLSSTETAYKSKIGSFVGGLGGTTMMAVDTQYTETSRGAITNPAGQLAGTWVDSTAAPTTLTNTNIYNEALKAATNQFGGVNKDASYIVLTSHGHTMSGFGSQWCGWHGWNSANLNLSYTFVPYQYDQSANCGGYDTTGLVQHEIMESQTDPSGTCATTCYSTGWYQGGNSATVETENADVCVTNSSTQPWTMSRYVAGVLRTVHAVMSNRDHQCEFFFLPVASASATSSASSGLHSANATCAWDRSPDSYNYGTQSEAFASATRTDSFPPLSSVVTCTVSTTDTAAPTPRSVTVSTTGGAGATTTSTSGYGLPFSAKGTNKVCVSGSFTYADATLSIPSICTTF